MRFLLAITAIALPSVVLAQPANDQSADIARVAVYLVALRDSKADLRRMVTSDVVLIDSKSQQPRTLDQFFSYATECKLQKIEAVASRNSGLPISTTWNCNRFQIINGKPVWDERTASFWFNGDKISRISWGERPVVFIAPLRPTGGK